MLPMYRTHLYSEFRACERFGLLPPGINHCWDDNLPWMQALLLAYSEIRNIEEMQFATALAGAKV